jgi:hypothetical protein
MFFSIFLSSIHDLAFCTNPYQELSSLLNGTSQINGCPACPGEKSIPVRNPAPLWLINDIHHTSAEDLRSALLKLCKKCPAARAFLMNKKLFPTGWRKLHQVRSVNSSRKFVFTVRRKATRSLIVIRSKLATSVYGLPVHLTVPTRCLPFDL